MQCHNALLLWNVFHPSVSVHFFFAKSTHFVYITKTFFLIVDVELTTNWHAVNMYIKEHYRLRQNNQKMQILSSLLLKITSQLSIAIGNYAWFQFFNYVKVTCYNCRYTTTTVFYHINFIVKDEGKAKKWRSFILFHVNWYKNTHVFPFFAVSSHQQPAWCMNVSCTITTWPKVTLPFRIPLFVLNKNLHIICVHWNVGKLDPSSIFGASPFTFYT